MTSSPTRPKSTPLKPHQVKVYVFGGGVTGLTAAHELILRGFEVCLFESERALGPQGILDTPTVGGMARTQYASVLEPPQKVRPSDEGEGEGVRLYFQSADVRALATRFLTKMSEGNHDILQNFEPQLTKDVLFRFFKRALAAVLVEEADLLNPALEHFSEVFSKAVPGLPQEILGKANGVWKKRREKTLRALRVKPEELKADFKVKDRIKHRMREEFRKAASELFARNIVGKPATVSEWIENARKVVSVTPPGIPGRRVVARRLAGAFVQSLWSPVKGGRTTSEDTALREKLLKFLQEFLGSQSGGVPDESLLRVLPWHVTESLITALRRLLFRKKDPLDEIHQICQDTVPEWARARAAPHVSGELAGARSFTSFWLEFETSGEEVRPTQTSTNQLRLAIGKLNELIADGAFATGASRKDGREASEQIGLGIYVQGFGENPRGGQLTQWVKAALKQGHASKKEFATPNQVPPVNPQLRPQIEDFGDAQDKLPQQAGQSDLPKAADNWVRIVIHRPQVPGEHGYRFFPSYYRHVFDTMKRIPRYDSQGRPIGGTVMDNLVSLPQIGIFSESSAPFLMSWSPLQAGDALSRMDYNQRNAANLNLQNQDLLQFSLRVLRYMTTCSQRRAAEMEGISWWDYLEGRDRKTGTKLYAYSEPFKHLVQSSSRILAALDGKSGDARTCGNTYVQLLTQAMVPTPHDNSTLNGPTSEAWLSHWKTHLERLGVQFRHGELQKLYLDGDKEKWLSAQVFCPTQDTQILTLPKDENPQEKGKQDKSIYFLVATDLLSAARVTRPLHDRLVTELKDFAYKPVAPKNAPRPVRLEPDKSFNRKDRDRLQTISGIQYFFKRHVNVFDGYIYCVDAEWGLSAICSHLVWQDRPLSPRSIYQSILSVDIGDWNATSRRLQKKAWQCDPWELQEEVLHQLRVSLSGRGPDQNPASYILPDPDWVHIDANLEYGPVAMKPSASRGGRRKEPRKRLRLNKSPYVVPIAGDWKRRPGPEPWDPTYQARLGNTWSYEGQVWQSPHGGYPVQYDRLVFAGTYLKTFTRMTTMESANESARHAVNAILDHCVSQLPQHHALRGFWDSPAGGNVVNPYDRGVFPTTPFGDYCRIWNLERNELPDFELLQRQDEQNWNEGKPHPWDAVGLELVPSLMTQVYNSGSLLEELIKRVSKRGKDTPLAVHSVLAGLRYLREILEGRHPSQGR